jgi:hypothetical protein
MYDGAVTKKTTRPQRERDVEAVLAQNRFGGDKFARVRTGTLVRRSEHWHREHPGYPRGQVGVVVGSEVYDREETLGEGRGLVTFPVVHWEGEVSSSVTHPDNAEVADSVYARELARRRGR